MNGSSDFGIFRVASQTVTLGVLYAVQCGGVNNDFCAYFQAIKMPLSFPQMLIPTRLTRLSCCARSWVQIIWVHIWYELEPYIVHHGRYFFVKRRLWAVIHWGQCEDPNLSRRCPLPKLHEQGGIGRASPRFSDLKESWAESWRDASRHWCAPSWYPGHREKVYSIIMFNVSEVKYYSITFNDANCALDSGRKSEF